MCWLVCSFPRCRADDRIEKPAPTFVSDSEILVTMPDNRQKVFEFDRVYSPKATQAEVYEDASAIITSCIDGYNVAFMGRSCC